jgi:hypothetical protein
MSQPTSFVILADDEVDAAVAKLAVVLNSTTEASKASWVRRLCRLPGGELGAVVRTCAVINNAIDREHPWVPEGGMNVYDVAYPLKEAVSILTSGSSPELEVERRAKLFEAFQAAKTKREAAKRKAEEEAAARAAQDRLDETRFHARNWETDFSDTGRVLLGLAVLVQGRDSALADDLRTLAQHQRCRLGGDLTNPLPYPRCEWDKGPSTSTGWQWWKRAIGKPSV